MKNIWASLLKWIVLLTLSQVSGLVLFQFDGAKEKNVIDKVLKIVKDNNVRDESDLKNVLFKTILMEAGPALKSYRRNQDFKGFQHKILAKRVVPHGQEVKEFEYDKKFRTLFKPLVRLHKKQQDPKNWSHKKDNYDLIYVIDGKENKDAENVGKDDSLLQPFLKDFAEIKYLPTKKDLAGSLNDKRETTVKLTSRPMTQNRVKLVDSTVKNFDEKKVSYHKLRNSLRHVLGSQIGERVSLDIDKQYQEPSVTSNLYKILSQIPLNKAYNDQRENLKSKKHKFGSVGPLFSKQLIVRQDWYDPLIESKLRKHNHKSFKSNKYDIESNNLISDMDNEHKKVKPNIISKLKKPSKKPGWLSKLGKLLSKLFAKTEKPHEGVTSSPSIQRSELLFYQPINNINNLPRSLKTLLEKEKTEDTSFSSESGTMNVDDTQKLFVPVGHMNSKQIKMQEKNREIDSEDNIMNSLLQNRLKYHVKSNYDAAAKYKMFKLLKQIAQLKSNGINQNKNVAMKKIKLGPSYKLRTHIKSGEEEEELLKLKKSLDSEETTTSHPMTIMPHYPFWNYWTYDRQIPQDECKGRLIQQGRVCVGMWA